MKIRIGNDISLDVTLLYNSYNDEYVNINSIKAFIINASKEKEFEEDLNNRVKFISRFPVEPYVDAYTSTAYDIKSSGYPTWRAYPKNHVYGTYSGFGLNPYWPNIYRPMPEHNLTEYQAEIKYTEDRDKVRVFFPAEAQFYTGTYNLVIVAKIYDPGYSKDNLRTVTMDYENVFELVNTSSADGVDSAVTLNVASTTRKGSAQNVVITGDTQIGPTGFGWLHAKVSPVSVNDPSVTWSVADEDVLYIAIINKQPNDCKYVALGMPDEVNEYKATIYATSNQTPGVQGQITVTISKEFHGDIYVNEGAYDSDNMSGGDIKLTLTNGEQVNVDLSKATGWYEGQ